MRRLSKSADGHAFYGVWRLMKSVWDFLLVLFHLKTHHLDVSGCSRSTFTHSLPLSVTASCCPCSLCSSWPSSSSSPLEFRSPRSPPPHRLQNEETFSVWRYDRGVRTLLNRQRCVSAETRMSGWKENTRGSTRLFAQVCDSAFVCLDSCWRRTNITPSRLDWEDLAFKDSLLRAWPNTRRIDWCGSFF